jgi:uncharacterized membrane protein (UPF0127 family)
MSPKGYAYNQTRQKYLATELHVANTHWTRLRGLLGTDAGEFASGKGLWIVPCRGVHTMAMRFPIDVLYLDSHRTVVHMEENLRPWRIAPVNLRTTTVLELPPKTLSQTETHLGDAIDIHVDQNGAAR